MKTGKFILFISGLCINFISANVCAADLMDVYEKALVNDPQFKAANAKWLAERENLFISKADLLPQLNASGSISQNHNENEYGNYNNRTIGYSLQLTQPIFDFGKLATVWGTKAAIKSAQAVFLAAKENLILRTAEAYFNSLLAKDILHYTKSNKETLKRLFTQSKHKFDVGLISVTDLEDARAKYDQAIADEIKSINHLDDSLEKLSEITKIRYKNLKPMKDNFPLLKPNPTNIEKWAKAAGQQNLELIATRFATIAARENIKIKNAGHLPTITAQGKYDYLHDNNHRTPLGGSVGIHNKTASSTIGISLPIFLGGKISASARQADYLYQEKVAQQEKTHREVVSKTRQNYLGVFSNISEIKANKQAIKSAKSSLRATRASYSVGTRTMADVLQAQTQLYDTQKKYVENERNYIIQLLNLKALTGTLDIEDIKEINSWLEKPRAKARTNKKTVIKKRKSSRPTKVRKNRPKKSTKKITVIKTEKVKPARIKNKK